LLKTILLDLIQRDDLSLPEITIRRKLIEWGINQEPSMNKEVEKWEKSDYNKLKNRIRDFVQHIRFFTIPLDEYYSDVCPYRGAIPRRTVELLVERYHIVEDTSLPPDALRPLPSRGLEK
jgi:hypothetical protein